MDWRKRPARWSVANWLGLTPRATARLDAQRPRRQRRQRRAVSVADARPARLILIAANLSAALHTALEPLWTTGTRVSDPIASINGGRVALRRVRENEQIRTRLDDEYSFRLELQRM